MRLKGLSSPIGSATLEVREILLRDREVKARRVSRGPRPCGGGKKGREKGCPGEASY